MNTPSTSGRKAPTSKAQPKAEQAAKGESSARRTPPRKPAKDSVRELVRAHPDMPARDLARELAKMPPKELARELARKPAKAFARQLARKPAKDLARDLARKSVRKAARRQEDVPGGNGHAEAEVPVRTHPGARRSLAEERKDQQERLLADLSGLRARFEEALEKFSLKAHGWMADIHARVSGETPPDPSPPLSLLTLRRARAAVSDLKVKPEKGRFKDLERILETVEELRSLLPRS